MTLALSTVLAACATTQTTSTTWSDPNGRPARSKPSKRWSAGQPVLGAVAGALIGGALLAGPGGISIAGATEGAAVGGVASSAESRAHKVSIRLDDGGHCTFSYDDHSPFRPGEWVVWTARDLLRS